MVDNIALAQGIVGGILLARAEKTPKAGMRAGLLMGVTGGLGPAGLVLAQATIRSQHRADLAARAATAKQGPPTIGGSGTGGVPQAGGPGPQTPNAGQSAAGQAQLGANVPAPAAPLSPPSPTPRSADDFRETLSKQTELLQKLMVLVEELTKQSRRQTVELDRVVEFVTKPPKAGDAPAKPAR